MILRGGLALVEPELEDEDVEGYVPEAMFDEEDTGRKRKKGKEGSIKGRL